MTDSCECWDYCGEGEPVEFHTVTTPVARKEHKCDLCIFPIRTGEQYEQTRFKYDGVWEIERFHTACSALRKVFNEAFGDPGDPGATCVWGNLTALLRCAETCAAADPEETDGDPEKAKEFVRLAREHMSREAGAA